MGEASLKALLEKKNVRVYGRSCDRISRRSPVIDLRNRPREVQVILKVRGIRSLLLLWRRVSNLYLGRGWPGCRIYINSI
jgi:hypothetical protein